MSYRNKNLLKIAQYAPCMMCGKKDGTVVAAHSNQIKDGKGTGIKANDYRIAYLCHFHHTQIDEGSKFDKAGKIEAWEEAHRKTIGWLFDNHYLDVKM